MQYVTVIVVAEDVKDKVRTSVLIMNVSTWNASLIRAKVIETSQ